MNSTSVTPAIISQITSVTSGGMNRSRSVRTTALQFALVSGNCAAARPAIVATSACACSGVAPGARRPRTNTARRSRAVVLATGPSGIHSRWFCGNEKFSGITPTTTVGWPLMRIVRPITPGSALYRCVHTQWLSSTTFACARPVIVGPEPLTENRRDTQERKQVRADRGAGIALRLSAVGHVRLRPCVPASAENDFALSDSSCKSTYDKEAWLTPSVSFTPSTTNRRSGS